MMRKIILTTILLGFVSITIAQVGINNTDPKASLDITASNVATPNNTDGILIPRVDDFPSPVPTAAQNGMLIFVTGNGTPTKGFYYWDQSLVNWVSVIGSNVDKIDDLSDGKSDNDGANNGSSIFLGIDAGEVDDLSDNQNVGIGFEALNANTTGFKNTATGYRSLLKNTSGSSNTATGHHSLNKNTTGISNTATGVSSLYNNTTGANNTANGFQSLFLNTTGNFNTANGLSSLNNNTTGSYNTANGYQSLYSNTTGSYNTAIGLLSLYSNSTGVRNMANGSYSLYSNSTGSDNIAIGTRALYTNSTGFNNVATGTRALYTNSTGSSNTATGHYSLNFNTTGSLNSAFGNSSLYRNTSGNNNTSVGFQSLYNNTEGSSNTSYGQQSLFSNTTGSSNVALGRFSGYFETGSNKLYIENTNADANNALIYGEFGTNNSTFGNILRTNSEFQIGNPAGTGYAFPTTDGTASYILQTDGAGALSFIDPATIGDNDWTVVGPDIERQSGNVYIGDTNATNNNLYISNQIIDWDDSAYVLDPNGNSKVNEIEFDNGNASDPSVRFSDLDTGFYSPGNGTSAYSANGTEAFRISNTGNISMGNISSMNYKLLIQSPIQANKIYLGNIGSGLNDDVMKIEHNSQRGDALQIDMTNYYNLASRSAISAVNDLANVSTNIAKYAPGGTSYGVENSIGGNSNGIAYGINNTINGTGTGTKYGSYNLISTSAGGTHYGIYSDVQKSTGYAGYFIGRLSLGNTTTNRYLMPATDGTANQIMQTNGSGVLSFVDPTTVGTDNQDLSLIGNTLSLTNDATTVDLSGYLDNTDDQNLTGATLTGTSLQIDIENGSSSTVDLVGLQDGDTQNTLDQAYDEGGAGAGRTIAADNGAVNITGTDGLQVTGTFSTGTSITLSGAGTRMFFNPRKAAFRAGNINFNQWNDGFVGDYSVAMGNNTIASGEASTAVGSYASANNDFSIAIGKTTTASGEGATALGYNTSAIGDRSVAIGSVTIASGHSSIALGGGSNALGFSSTAIGYNTIASTSYSTALGAFTDASGLYSTSIGRSTNASGETSTAMGRDTEASGDYSTAMGFSSFAPSYAETTIGVNNTVYTPTSATVFDASDRLFSIGNGTNISNKSNALTIYKNGLMNINDEYDMPLTDGTANQIMQTNGSGVVSFVDPTTVGTDDQNLTGASLTGTSLQIDIENGSSTTVDLVGLQDGNTQNTLDQAYDEGGAGVGRTITATDGAVTIAGEDGFLVTGTLNTGNVAPSGSGTKMFFNPRKGAFRAGYASSTTWDNANIGNHSIAFGYATTASGNYATAFGYSTQATGLRSTAIGRENTASGENAVSIGLLSTASGTNAIAMGEQSTATNGNTFSIGSYANATGVSSMALGSNLTASGNISFAFGSSITAPSYGETALGINNTNYTPNSTISFNSSDRLLSIGNGTLPSSRSNALTIYKSGLMNINDEYNMPLTDGTANQVMQTNGAGQVSFVNSSSIGTDNQNITGSGLSGTDLTIGIQNGTSETVSLASLANDWKLTGNSGTNPSSNFLGTTDNQALTFRTNNTEKLRILTDGRVGIGTSTPNTKLAVSGIITAAFEPAQTNKLEVAHGGLNAYLNVVGAGNLNFRHEGVTGMTFTDTNRLGIGTAAPNYSLSVAGEVNLNEGIASGNALRVNGATALWYNGTYFSWGFGGTANYFADPVGIGITNPSYKLDVRQSLSASYVAQVYNTNTGPDADGLRIQLGITNPTSTNNYIGFHEAGGGRIGEITGNPSGNIIYTSVSDRRLKQNIKDVNQALKIINQIQPRTYAFKKSPTIEEYGFIAQELQPIYPQAVSGSPDSDVKTNPMMVDYSRLTPILTAGIKELDAKLTSQQKDIASLKEENKLLKQQLLKYQTLEERLTSLENKIESNLIEEIYVEKKK